nr:hypothetical protein Iba_chr10eCG14660 [Ipomoea batatas]
MSENGDRLSRVEAEEVVGEGEAVRRNRGLREANSMRERAGGEDRGQVCRDEAAKGAAEERQLAENDKVRSIGRDRHIKNEEMGLRVGWSMA